MGLRTKPPANPTAAQQPMQSLDITFRPSADLISLVRVFVADFYSRIASDPDVAHRLALATHELLDNAAKYSADGETSFAIQFDAHTSAILVRAENRARDSEITKLRRVFQEMSTAPSADAFYTDSMRRTAKRKSGSGGLGLPRIWAESEMDLKLSVDGPRVTIVAQGRV
jgi:hypothetical protein